MPESLLWSSKGAYDKAIEYYELALASDLKTFGPDHPDVAIDIYNLGFAWNSKGEFDKALKHYKKALKILESSLGFNHPTSHTVRQNLESAQAKLATAE